MKRREVGKYFKRIEIDLEHGRTGSVKTLLERHWSTDTDPLGIAAEAVLWLRSRELPDFPTAGCSLTHFLRSDHGVKHDSVDDLAAVIIDRWVQLTVMEGLEWADREGNKYWFSAEVAVGLGKAHALFHIYRQQDDIRKKHRQTKRSIWDEIARSMGDVSSKTEARNVLAEGEHRIEALGDRWRVYPDGDDLCAVNSRTHHPKQIKLAYFLKEYLKLR